jgi:hypothetical protein
LLPIDSRGACSRAMRTSSTSSSRRHRGAWPTCVRRRAPRRRHRGSAPPSAPCRRCADRASVIAVWRRHRRRVKSSGKRLTSSTVAPRGDLPARGSQTPHAVVEHRGKRITHCATCPAPTSSRRNRGPSVPQHAVGEAAPRGHDSAAAPLSNTSSRRTQCRAAAGQVLDAVCRRCAGPPTPSVRRSSRGARPLRSGRRQEHRARRRELAGAQQPIRSSRRSPGQRDATACPRRRP